MTRKALTQGGKNIEPAIEREAATNMLIHFPLGEPAQHREARSSVLTNAYALALGIFCGRYPSTVTLAFTITGITGVIMLLSKAYSNEHARATKTNGEAELGLAEKGTFRTALQLVPIIGSLAVLSILVSWRFSVLVVGFTIPMWLFVEHEIHEVLNVDSYLQDLRQAWKCAQGRQCVPDECLKEMKSHEPKIELLTWIVFAWLISVVLQSPCWLPLVKSALRHGS